MTELPVSTRGKLASFIRLLASDRDGEVVAAACALERVLKSAGADIHALADQVEHTNGRGLTEAEMKKVFDAGYEAGVCAAEAKVQHDEDGFRSVNGAASWHKMAVFCQERKARLRGNEVDFIDDMCGWTTWKEPTSKQAKWLSSIYARLDGR